MTDSEEARLRDAVLARLRQEQSVRSTADRAILERIKETREELGAGNAELWRLQREFRQEVDGRLRNVQEVSERAVGRIDAATSANAELADRVRELAEAVQASTARIDQLYSTVAAQPRTSKRPRAASAMWGAVGAPIVLVLLGALSWGLKHWGIDIGWPQ